MFDDTTETVSDDTSVVETEVETQSDELDLTIDEIIKLNESDFPEFADDANHKGMKPLQHWMQHVPEDVRKHIANLRAEVEILKNQLSSFSTEWAGKRNTVNIRNQELLQKKQRLQTEEAKFRAY